MNVEQPVEDTAQSVQPQPAPSGATSRTIAAASTNERASKGAENAENNAAEDVSSNAGSGSSEAVSDELTGGSRWDLSTKRIVLVLMLIAVIAIIWLSRSVISMLIVSSIIAYLLKPIVDLAERVRIPRGLSTVFLFLLVLVVIILTPVIVVPILYRQLSELAAFDEQVIVNNLNSWLLTVVENIQNATFFGFTIPYGDLLRQFQNNIDTFEPTLEQILSYVQQIIWTTTNVVGSTAAISFSVVGGIFQLLLGALLVFFTSLYLTKDAPRIITYVEGLFPISYQPEMEELIRRIGKVWQGFFRGQVVLSLVIGFMTWGALALLSTPGALVLSIVAAILEIIPNLGPILAMIPAVLVALIQGSNNEALMEFGRPGYMLMVVGAYFLIQQIENSIIVPRVIGDSVNLHPVIVMCGVVVGFSLGGVLGAFLAAPFIATLRVVGSYVHAKLLDYPPFRGGARVRPLSTYRRIVTGEELKRQQADATADAAEEEQEEEEEAGQGEPAADTRAEGVMQPVAMALKDTDDPSFGPGRVDRTQTA